MKINILKHRLAHTVALFCTALSVVPAWGGESEIRFCTDSIRGIGEQGMGLWYSAALNIDVATAKSFNGCKVDAVSFALGSTTAEKVTVFITRDLKQAPVWTKEVAPEAGKWQSVAVDTDFSIDGKPFYIGYKLHGTSMFDEPMGFDIETGGPYNTLGSFAIANAEALLGASWQTAPDYLGNVCISCHVSGEIPEIYLCPLGMRFGQYQKPETPFTVMMPFFNSGSESVESIDVEVTAGTNAPQALTIKLESPLQSGAYGRVSFPVTLATDAVEEHLSLRVLKVNGKENGAGSPQVFGAITCSDDLFPRAFVVEDFTGSTCGYCPIGYVAMDKLTEEYKDKETRFIPIAVHNYGKSAVHCDAYDDFVKFYNFASAPASIVNRDLHSFPSANNLKATWGEMSQLSVGKVDLEAWFTDEDKAEVNVTATSTFVRDYDEAAYSLAFVLTEDKVGPYKQANYYNDNPSVPEFYGKGDHVMIMYDHVARTIIGWDGIEGSVPANVVKGLEYPYTTAVSLESCNNPDASRLICLMLRKSDGVIVNAEYVDLADVKVKEVEGVEGVTADSRVIEGEEYYSLSGMRVTAPVSGQPYIVKRNYTDGSSKVKRIIKTR